MSALSKAAYNIAYPIGLMRKRTTPQNRTRQQCVEPNLGLLKRYTGLTISNPNFLTSEIINLLPLAEEPFVTSTSQAQEKQEEGAFAPPRMHSRPSS
jgi:hypothetical protein